MCKVILLVGLVVGCVVPGYSQLLSFGVKGGVPLTDALNGFSQDGGTVSTHTGRWFAGPTVELHLPFRLSVEVDALYRRESYGVSANSTTGAAAVTQWFTGDPATTVTPTSSRFSHSLNNLQFPFLAKYDLHGGLLRPFIDGGLTYRYVFGGGPITSANSAGVTVGGGLAIKLLLLRLSPEIRYTHWGNDDIYPPYVTHTSNQVDVLVGLTF